MRRPLLESPRIGPRGGIVGRSRKLPPADAAELIEAHAADGWSLVGIAMKLGTSAEILRRWCDNDAALAAALSRGRERERHALHNKLFRTAMEEDSRDSVIAAMFLLKARHGYKEGVDPIDSGARVAVNIVLPGARPLSDFIEVKNADGSDSDRLPARSP